MLHNVARFSGLAYLVAGFALGAVAASGSYWLRKHCYRAIPSYLQNRCRRRYASQCYCELSDYRCCKVCGRFGTFGTICGHGNDVVDGI